MTTATWDLLERRGLDAEDLVMKGWTVDLDRDGGERLSIPFPKDGLIAGHKFRSFDKPRHEQWSAKWEDGPVAYNGDCLQDDALIGQPLIITEGEIDCETALRAGFHRVISAPNGSGGSSTQRTAEETLTATAYNWLRSLMPFLHKDRVHEIILAVDGDDAGAKLMHDLSLHLGRARCKFVTYPKTKRPDLGRDRTKDLNEVLVEYGIKGVVETINRAQWVQVKGVSLMSQLAPLPPQAIYDIGFDLLGQNYRMRMGDFTVVTGVPGYGKTSFVNDLCCRVALTHGLKIAWGSFEQSPQRDHRRNLRGWYLECLPRHQTPEMLEKADRWIDQQHVFIVPDEDEDSDLDWLLDCMETAVLRYGVKVVVIDPWNEVEHVRERGESETEYIGRALRTLKRFAKKFQVHIILVAHPRILQKVNGKYQMPSLYEISGSQNWYNKADIGLIVHREDADSTVIKVQKSRYHDIIGKPGEVKVAYCNDDKRFRELERLA